MILAFISQIETAHILIQSAYTLAKNLQKSFAILTFVQSDETISPNKNAIINELLKTEELIKNTQVIVRVEKVDNLAEICEELDASFLFMQLTDNSSKNIRQHLSACRNLRIPYVLFKNDFDFMHLEKVLLPVNFLEEEVEKAQFASAFGRFCGSEINMLVANDYGSKAQTNAEKMKQLFEKFDFTFTLEKATKDSFKVERESIQIAEAKNAGLIIVSASRDYGLDDILFGPKELHLVKKSPVPLLIVNPRGDLYALCD